MLHHWAVLKIRGDIGTMAKQIMRPTWTENDTMEQITIATNTREIIGDHDRVQGQGRHGDGTSIEVADEKGLVPGNGYQRIIG